MTAIATIEQFVYGAEASFQSVLVDRSINFEREAGFAIQILTSGDYIAKLAASDRQSVVNAVTNIAAIGISLNPAKKQAYLVPRKGKICLDISYMGLIDLAIDSGSIMWAQAALVHAHDAFALNGFDKPPTHSFNPFAKDRGEMVGAYVVVKMHSGDYLTECMSREEIDAIKNRSESVKAGKTSPWDTDYGEMAKKGLALDTPIPTPAGWATMGTLQVGDSVFDKDGAVVTIKAVSEVKHLPCFKVTFSGGEEIVCDDEHRWLARAGSSHANRRPYEVMTVNQMFQAKKDGLSVTIPMQGALDTTEADLPVDPYLLGYWLGDGSTGRAQITCCGVDVESLKAEIARAGYGLGTVTQDPRSADTFCIGVLNGFVTGLGSIGVLDDKHVPGIYMRGSVQQRKQLLAGLLDSDGHLDKARGRVHFYNKNQRLSAAVFELAASLGESPTEEIKTMRGFGVVTTSHFVQWQPSFCPCINPRKAANYRERKISRYRAIESIEVVPTVPTRCIAVTGESETFLAGRSMAPTHNTVVKRAYKYWPKSDRLDQAIHHLNTDGGEGLAMLAKPAAVDPAPIIEGARATKTVDELNAYWAEHNGNLANDLTAHDALKKACRAHKKRLAAEAAKNEATDVEVKDAVATA